MHADRILILDFGSQYTQLIARRVREAGVFCEILPFDVDPGRIASFGARGFILSGGPESVYDALDYRIPAPVLASGAPLLGICYGMQAMASQLGGKVAPSTEREFGHAVVRQTADCVLLDGLEGAEGHAEQLNVWMSHGDRVEGLPAGFEVVATSANAPLAAMQDVERRYFALQFHPEVTHTEQGAVILSRFVHDVCGCASEWTSANIIDDAIERMRAQVGNGQVVLGLSGGVDSSVVAALLQRAIGERLHCIFVDNGLLRLGEGDEVMATFAQLMGVNVTRVDASDLFLNALAGEPDPERKRKIIGAKFIDVFDREAGRLDDVGFLAQGTIYPDVIESAGAASGKAHVIKSHHNVGGLPDTMTLELVEPLRELFKDEVRKLGMELGLPRELVFRHPFPGPGLGVRILGEVHAAYADTLRQADWIFIQELRDAGWYDRVSQAFAVYLPVRSVGVMGDQRRYDHVIALRAVETVDFMTARWAHLPYDLLERCSNRIINEVAGVSRVVYDVSGKPPATIEWE
ncbi:MAG: glutamine-hydrolyzing GMP synthase [Pseudomonadota bacterium]